MLRVQRLVRAGAISDAELLRLRDQAFVVVRCSRLDAPTAARITRSAGRARDGPAGLAAVAVVFTLSVSRNL